MNLNHLMPTDKIILTFILNEFDNNKSGKDIVYIATDVANMLIDKNQPFKDRFYKVKFVNRVSYFINLAIQIHSEKK